MHIDFDPQTGIITLGYLKFAVESAISYGSAVLGAIMHYRKMQALTDAQCQANGLKVDEITVAKARMRKDFIHDYGKIYFNKLEQIAGETPSQLDDKLFLYLRKMGTAFTEVIGDTPTDAEIQHMKDVASALAYENKKTATTPIVITPPKPSVIPDTPVKQGSKIVPSMKKMRKQPKGNDNV